MTSAHYGRMRLGRCLAVNYGNLGCQLDVRTQFDAWCSGRRTCNVRVSSIIDSVPDEAFPCSRDFRGYLEASYICIKGLQQRRIFSLPNYYTPAAATKVGGIKLSWCPSVRISACLSVSSI